MGERPTTIRVLVISPVRLYREGLADVLSRIPSMTIVGAEPDSRHAAARMPQWAPNVVLLDFALPQNQIELREIARLAPAVPVVALGVDESEAEVLAVTAASITGYLSREASIEELVEVVESAARGEVICSSRLAGTLVRRLATLAARSRTEAPPQPLRQLTRREREVVGFLERNLTNKEIAGQLGIQVATVKNHVHNLLDKLSVRRRGEAARLISCARGEVESPAFHASQTDR